MLFRLLLTAGTISLCGSAFADDRDEARERMPKVIEWQGHYLILEGENFLPIERGLVTPNITIFEIEEDYLPSGKSTLETQIEGCDPADRGAQSVTDTGEARAALTAEVAVDYASAAAARARQQQHCPESLGKTYGSGSYVYDEDFNDLAGQDFDEGTKTWLAWFLYGEKEEPKNIMIVGQGGAKRADDPALDIFSYDNGMIVDVLFDPNTYNGRQEPGLGETGTAPAPELPVKVTFELQPKDPIEVTDNGLMDLEGVTEEIDRIVEKFARHNSGAQDVLIVSRGGTPETFDVAEARLKAIRETVQARLGSETTVSSVSLGVAAPICSDDDPACWVLNRSTLLYMQPR